MTAPRKPQPLAPGEPLARVRGHWLAFDRDCPPEAAIDRFRRKYGAEPREVLAAGVLLLVGPIPGKQER